MNEERYILFDQYLQGKMSVEEKINFEKQLSEDSELASALEIFKELQVHLENKFGDEKERNVYTKNLKMISKAHFKTSKPKVTDFKPIYYAVAASVAVLIGLFVLNQNPNFEDFNQPESAHFTERVGVNIHLKQAEIAFNAQNYKEAIPIFEMILNSSKTPEIQYFYGISLLESDRIQEAETVFNELKSGNSIYKNKAIWSLALSKLKQKDYDSCKAILLTIPDDFEDYDQVQELLNELD